MRKHITIVILVIIFVGIMMTGCSTAQEPVQPAEKPKEEATDLPPTEVPPTATSEPTATTIPTPTPLPGSIMLPVDTMAHEIPWLPYDPSTAPATYFFLFNYAIPPFNSPLVRQAFSAAIDREVLVETVIKYYPGDTQAATSFTPPATLGRDLYNQVGISFDPARAKDLLEEAGYSDPSKFPTVTLLTNTSGGGTPYLHINLAEEMGRMWNEYLGVSVSVEYMEWGPYRELVQSDPPEIFRLGWAADYNDPDNFLREIFETGGEYNWGNFSNAEFDQLVQTAAEITDPAERQELYIQAERILCETEVGLIPIYHYSYNIR